MPNFNWNAKSNETSARLECRCFLFFLASDKPINISRIIDEFFLKIKCMIFIYYLKVCLWHFIKSGKINLLFKSSTQDIIALTCSCKFYSVFVNMVTTDREVAIKVAIKDKDCSTWTTLLILMLNNRYFLYKWRYEWHLSRWYHKVNIMCIQDRQTKQMGTISHFGACLRYAHLSQKLLAGNFGYDWVGF